MQEYKITVEPGSENKRLDVFLMEFATTQNLGFSRTFINSQVHSGFTTIQGKPVVKPNHKVKLSDEIIFRVEEKKVDVLEPENIELNVVYEDSDIAVIDKPAGLVVHPAPGNTKHTLVNALLYRFNSLSSINPSRPGIVHRLDKETSGILVVAKNNKAHLALIKQFSDHSIKRIYVALVKKAMEFQENIIEMSIGRHPDKRERMAVGFATCTRSAKTYYKTLKKSADYSLVELHPYTGRTHQLRVHMSFIGHPILGDSKYGKHNPFPRLALHAKSLGFLHPSTGKFVEFRSPVPKEFIEFIDSL
jgi:23S rRNA pseudouridine1911/1915/1917 synthase